MDFKNVLENYKADLERKTNFVVAIAPQVITLDEPSLSLAFKGFQILGNGRARLILDGAFSVSGEGSEFFLQTVLNASFRLASITSEVGHFAFSEFGWGQVFYEAGDGGRYASEKENFFTYNDSLTIALEFFIEPQRQGVYT